ncbi:spore coat protein [Mesobacillus harenae]|uniref:spore coat protein n=1 Tax=Mesobacillus harenae TaxID=2213203 RepID=UPI00157FD310
MNELIQKIIGMGGMTEQVIATDFLIAAKSGVRNLAVAITETATPEMREILREQLRTAVETHENISNYMISKGYYYPSDISQQIHVDMTAAETAMNLADK